MRTLNRFCAAKRLACLGLAALLLFAPAAYAETTEPTAPPEGTVEPEPTPTPAPKVDFKDLQDRRDEAQEKVDEYTQQIKDAQAQGKTAKQLKSQYQQQQQALKETIELINQQIEALEIRITETEDAIDAKQAEIDARWAGFKERMAAMQMLNDGGSIALLSSVTNLYELLTFPQTLEDIAAKDQQVLGELNTDYDELNTLKEELDANVSQLEYTQAELDQKVSELAANIQAQNEKISQAEAEEQAAEASLSDAEREFQEAVEAIQSYLASQNNKYSSPDLYCSLNFGFPIAYYSRISNHFGTYGTNNWRKSPHGGTDLVAPRGTEIYAAADGIVTVSHVWGGGKSGNDSYGNYVMILHGKADDGNTYATLYGHMNTAPLVSEGQAVTKGQLIGYVGTTGNSTGYHLHLEVRVNNVRVDAERYIPLP